MRENCQSRSEDAFDRHLSLGSLPSRTLPATTAPVVLSTCRSLCWNIILSTINIYIDLNDALALAEQSGQLKYSPVFCYPRGPCTSWAVETAGARTAISPQTPPSFQMATQLWRLRGPFASTFCSSSPDFRGLTTVWLDSQLRLASRWLSVAKPSPLVKFSARMRLWWLGW
jgi:hypothetical protein